MRFPEDAPCYSAVEVVLDHDLPGIREVLSYGRTVFTDLKDRFYRAPTGIDEGQDANCYNTEWLKDGLDDPKPEMISRRFVILGGSMLMSETVLLCGGKLRTDREYLITEEGVSIHGTVVNNAETATLPRIGIGLALPKEDQQVCWYGRGPEENYPDRKKASLTGIYEKTVSEMHVPYVRPCECGGREDTRYLKIRDGQGHGVYVTADRYFHFSVLPWSVEEYTKADYQEDLPESSAVHLCLDGFHAGLGGDTGWTKNIHPEYQIPKGIYSYRFDIRIL